MKKGSVEQGVDAQGSQSNTIDVTISGGTNRPKSNTNSSLSQNSKNFLFGENVQGIRENSMLAYCAYINSDPASGENNSVIKEQETSHFTGSICGR